MNAVLIFNLDRYKFTDTSTCGRLYLPDGTLFCDTLEDADRDLDQNGEVENKVWGKTAIPYGIYPMVFRDSPRFKRRMIGLENVKGFQGILIHEGNSTADSNGCILLGKYRDPRYITDSKSTVAEFEQVVAKYQADGSETMLQVSKALEG
jgi:hypothetical protein